MATNKNKQSSSRFTAKSRTSSSSKNSKNTSLKSKGWWRQHATLVAFVAIFAAIGGYFLFITFAATANVYLRMGTASGPCIAGTTIQKCVGSPAQTWGELNGSNFQIKNGLDQCLDDWNGKVGTNPNNRAYIHVAPCYSNDRNQQWNWSDSRLVNVASHGCLNALGAATAAGTPLIVYTCNGQSNEIWKETAASTSSGSCAKLSATQSADVSNAKNAAHCLLSSYGWNNSTQFTCLSNIYDHESNWNYRALNGSSPYYNPYGIPQAYPGSKMAKMGSDWQTDATTQIKWGLAYIQSTYGTPCGAWAFWLQNHAY